MDIPCSQLSQQESEQMFRLTMQPARKHTKGQFESDTLGEYQMTTVAARGLGANEAHSLQMSVKLTKEVFLVPTRTT